MRAAYSFLTRRTRRVVVNADDLPMHWEERHIFSPMNEAKNYQLMKAERKNEEWTMEEAFSEGIIPMICLYCVLLLYMALRHWFPSKFEAFESVVIAFVHIFV